MSKDFTRVDWPVKPCPDTEPHEDPHVWGLGMWGMQMRPTNSFLCAGKPSHEVLSKLLLDAGLQLISWVDAVETQSGRMYPKGRQILERIDQYRRERGWLPEEHSGTND